MKPSRMTLCITAAIVALGGLFACGSSAVAQQTFTNTATGAPLDVDGLARQGGRNTSAVKAFMATGKDPYVEIAGCLPLGEQMYVEGCAGCHGRIGEGKIGPPLYDAIWIYPKNKTDKGIFETIFGGAKGLMAPHQDLELDDILKLIAWVRHMQKDDVKDADWLTSEQKKSYTPFNFERWKSSERNAAEAQQCQIAGR